MLTSGLGAARCHKCIVPTIIEEKTRCHGQEKSGHTSPRFRGHGVLKVKPSAAGRQEPSHLVVRLFAGASPSSRAAWRIRHAGDLPSTVLLPWYRGRAMSSPKVLQQAAASWKDGHVLVHTRLDSSRKNTLSYDYSMLSSNEGVLPFQSVDCGRVRHISPEGGWSSGSMRNIVCQEGVCLLATHTVWSQQGVVCKSHTQEKNRNHTSLSFTNFMQVRHAGGCEITAMCGMRQGCIGQHGCKTVWAAWMHDS